MTYVESITRISVRLTQLGLTSMGEPVRGIMAIGALAKFHGQVLAEVENALERGEIDLETYTTAMEMLIEEYARARFRNQIENTILQLRNEQSGFELRGSGV